MHDPAALLASALQHHRTGRLAQAEALYRQLLQSHPHHPDALHLLGLLAHQTDQHDIAVKLISQAMLIQRTDPGYCINLGLAYQALSRFKEAVACYQLAITIKPDYADAHNNLANVLTHQGKWVEAVAAYKKALAILPIYAEANLNLGNALVNLDKLDEAIVHFYRALTANPHLAEAYNNLANALTHQHKRPEAVACYKKALVIQPNHAEAHYNLGISLFDQGHIDEAILYYQKALTVRPDYAEVHDHLGNIFLNQGKLDKAVICYQQAISIRPNLALSYYNLGMAQVLIGDQDVAIENFYKSLTFNPDHSHARDAIAQIKLPYEHYLKILKRFHHWLRPLNYVEIGVESGASMALAEPPAVCIGIDPNPQIQFEFSAPTRIFAETSDHFFATHDLLEEFEGKTIDLAFIDGLHLFEGALKDFINIERYSSPDTVILIHDCIPLDAETSKRDRSTIFWSGDTWKIIPALKKFRPDLFVITIPTPPTGLGVVTRLDSNSMILSEKLDTIVDEYISLGYGYLERNKNEILVVTHDDWSLIQKRIRPLSS